jgi:hypothetical protein
VRSFRVSQFWGSLLYAGQKIRGEQWDSAIRSVERSWAATIVLDGQYVRDQMGYSSFHVTFDTYGHLFPGRGREASDRYEKSMDGFFAARRFHILNRRPPFSGDWLAC